MAYIEVDHSKFESVASEIDSYVAKMSKSMNQNNTDVALLSLNWQGSDFTQFATEFGKVNDEDSTHAKMGNALKSYSDYLRFAAKKYKDAQTNAVNRANSLPRY